MPNWYLQHAVSKLGHPGARVQPTATVSNEEQQENPFREDPKPYNPNTRRIPPFTKMQVIHGQCITCTLGNVRVVTLGFPPKSCLKGVFHAYALIGILRVHMDGGDEDGSAVSKAHG